MQKLTSLAIVLKLSYPFHFMQSVLCPVNFLTKPSKQLSSAANLFIRVIMATVLIITENVNNSIQLKHLRSEIAKIIRGITDLFSTVEVDF